MLVERAREFDNNEHVYRKHGHSYRRGILIKNAVAEDINVGSMPARLEVVVLDMTQAGKPESWDEYFDVIHISVDPNTVLNALMDIEARQALVADASGILVFVVGTEAQCNQLSRQVNRPGRIDEVYSVEVDGVPTLELAVIDLCGMPEQKTSTYVPYDPYIYRS